MLLFVLEGMQEQDIACSLHAHGDHAPLQSLLKELKEEMELPVTCEALRRTSSSSAGSAEQSTIPQLACMST